MSPNSAESQVAISGLTPEEAQARLDRFGPNEPAATQHYSFLSDLLHVFMNPLTLILVIAAVVSAFTGNELDHTTDPALAHLAGEARAFARISPVQKNRILLALKHNGHAVGFMGDGINDAPSLHAADVGISVSSAAD